MFSKKRLNGEKGQGLVEYALILVLVAIVVIVILATMGPAVSGVYCRIVVELGQPCSGATGGGLHFTGAEWANYEASHPGSSRAAVCSELGLSSGTALEYYNGPGGEKYIAASPSDNPHSYSGPYGWGSCA